MYILRIEHPVPSFEGWKRAFDSDPVSRRKSGVRRYRVMRPIDDPDYAMVELEFETRREAEAMHDRLRRLWSSVEGRVMSSPQVRLVELVEATELRRDKAE